MGLVWCNAIPAPFDMSQLPSKYLPIWNQLKQTKVCRITAPIQYHKTIVKMVKNKRDDDIAYRFMLAERHMTHELKTTVSGTVITFTLREILTIGGL
jgi:hypothetical protein